MDDSLWLCLLGFLLVVGVLWLVVELRAPYEDAYEDDFEYEDES